jgi:hypothetical protein
MKRQLDSMGDADYSTVEMESAVSGQETEPDAPLPASEQERLLKPSANGINIYGMMEAV